MNQKLIENICREVYLKYPELRGMQPKVQPFIAEKSHSSNASPKFLLIFQDKASTATSKALPYSVRVVVNMQGKILKMSMSR
jgi:hypothetical protein